MRDAFVAEVTRMLGEDDRLAVVLAAISADAFAPAAQAFPGRVVDVGIREQLMVGVASGLALAGLRPVVHTYAPFVVERAFEQLKLDLGHQDVGAVVVSVGASHDWSQGGTTHRSPGDVALLSTLPGWSVHVPGHPGDVAPILRAAVPGTGRHYVRLTTAATGRAAPGAGTGRMDVVRTGTRGTVVAVGPLLDTVLAAVGERDVTVLHATTVRPFDHVTLLATLGVPDVVLVEPTLAGTSSGVVTQALVHVPHRVLGLGVGPQDVRHYGTPAEHDRLHGLDAAGIARSLTGFWDDSP